MNIDQYLDIAKEYYGKAVKAVTKTETEKKLSQALSRNNWGASSTELREIARLTHDWQEYGIVMREIWNAMQYNGSRWRQIFKALTLIDFLIKNGAERVVEEARDKVYIIKALTGFSHYADGIEKGAGIREKAKQLVELLGDNDLIREEREKAKALRDKYTGIGNDGIRFSDSGYNGGSYDSSGFGGRYDSGTKNAYSDSVNEPSKAWDNGIKSNSKKALHSNDNEDDDFNPRAESTKPTRPSVTSEDDKYDDFSKSGDDKNADEINGKGKKKLQIKIRSAKTERQQPSLGAEPSEDLLFGERSDSKGKQEPADEFDLLGNDSISRSVPSTPFDPFGSSEPFRKEDEGDDWAGFESAKPSKSKDVDLFGDLTPAPTLTNQKFSQSSSFPTQNGNNLNFFGGFTSQTTVQSSVDFFAASGSAQSGQRPHPSMQFASQKKDNHASLAQDGKDALWGSGLVDLGNLSLNSKSSSVPVTQSQKASNIQAQPFPHSVAQSSTMGVPKSQVGNLAPMNQGIFSQAKQGSGVQQQQFNMQPSRAQPVMPQRGLQNANNGTSTSQQNEFDDLFF